MKTKLIEFYKRVKGELLAVFILALGVINIYGLYSSVTVQRISNDECLWIEKKISADSLVIVFREVKVGGVAYNAGIRNGDLLLEIKGKQIFDTQVAQYLLNSYNEGEFADYKIQRKNGEKANVKVYVKKLILVSQFSIMLFSMLFLVVAYLVYLAKTDGLQQGLFLKIGIGFSFLQVPNVLLQIFGISLVKVINPAFLLVMGVWLVLLSKLPFNIVHFFAIFPEPFYWVKNKRFSYFLKYAWIPFLAINLIQAIYHGYTAYSENRVPRYDFALITFAANAAYITGLFFLTMKYFQIKDETKRKPLFAILLAYYLGFAGFFFTIFIAPIFGDIVFNSPEYYTPILLMVLLPLAFGYSIFRYNLLDVTIVLRTTLVYAVATLALGGLYLTTVYLLGQIIGGAFSNDYKEIISGITFIILALLFQPTKEKIQTVMTKRFFPHQFEIQTVVTDFNNKLPRIVGYSNILDSLAEIFNNHLKVECFAIALKKEENRSAVVRNSGGKDIPLELQFHKESLDSLLEQKYSAGEKLVIDRAKMTTVFPNDNKKLLAAGVYSVIPLITNQKVIGFFLVGLSYSGKQYGGKDLEHLVSLANQSATALENARLYQAEAEKLKLERDLELARKIQKSLLPQIIPDFSSLDISGDMIPAMQVGGDYFDIIKVSDSKLFVIVGDVSGKGLSASLYMTKIQTLLQFACTENRTPAEILTNLNLQLSRILDTSSFVTMVMALFDLENRTVKIARAGHPPIFLQMNGTSEFISSRGIGIGLDRGGDKFGKLIEERVVHLEPGQIFTFYSDGITEAMNSVMGMYETDRMVSTIKSHKGASATEISKEVIKSVNTFAGETGQYDDITIVVVKVEN